MTGNTPAVQALTTPRAIATTNGPQRPVRSLRHGAGTRRHRIIEMMRALREPIVIAATLAVLTHAPVGAGLAAQEPSDFRHVTIATRVGPVTYHVYDRHLTRRLPVLLFLQGSTPMPLIGVLGPDSRRYGFSRDLLQYADRYHVVLIDKPGVPFVDTLRVDTITGDPIVPVPSAYTANNHQGWRVGAAAAVLDDVLRRVPSDSTRVVVVGYSEGGQVAPRVAVENPRVTHLVSINGAGLNQFYDGVIGARLRAAAGRTTRRQAQATIDSLFAVYRRI